MIDYVWWILGAGYFINLLGIISGFISAFFLLHYWHITDLSKHTKGVSDKMVLQFLLELFIPFYGGLIGYISIITFWTTKGNFGTKYETTYERCTKYRIFKW